jgi:hypothetical protein
MTEADWLAATDPALLLAFVGPIASDRKLRLLAAAYSRRVWDGVGAAGRRAVEVLERRADGAASDDDLRQAAAEAAREGMEKIDTHPSNAASWATGYPFWATAGLAPVPPLEAARAAACEGALAVGTRAAADRAVSLGYCPQPSPPCSCPALMVWLGYPRPVQIAAACWEAANEAGAAERAVQCLILRDIFHGPCRPVLLRRAWLYAGEHAVLKLAGTIYEERAFDLLPVLGDALEDADCDDRQVLAHCRSGGLHVRGCWLLDALLAKW